MMQRPFVAASGRTDATCDVSDPIDAFRGLLSLSPRFRSLRYQQY